MLRKPGSLQCLGFKTLSRLCSWFSLPTIRTILFLALSLSSFKNSLRVNSSKCFLTERKPQPEECFLCSSLEKSTEEHVLTKVFRERRKATLGHQQAFPCPPVPSPKPHSHSASASLFSVAVSPCILVTNVFYLESFSN